MDIVSNKMLSADNSPRFIASFSWTLSELWATFLFVAPLAAASLFLAGVSALFSQFNSDHGFCGHVAICCQDYATGADHQILLEWDVGLFALLLTFVCSVLFRGWDAVSVSVKAVCDLRVSLLGRPSYSGPLAVPNLGELVLLVLLDVLVNLGGTL